MICALIDEAVEPIPQAAPASSAHWPPVLERAWCSQCRRILTGIGICHCEPVPVPG